MYPCLIIIRHVRACSMRLANFLTSRKQSIIVFKIISLYLHLFAIILNTADDIISQLLCTPITYIEDIRIEVLLSEIVR